MKQKEFRGEIAAGAAQALHALFFDDVADGRFLLIPLGEDILQAAARLAIAGGPLRTLDGLHLATALTVQCRQIATTDQRLAEAALQNGLEVLPGAGHP